MIIEEKLPSQKANKYNLINKIYYYSKLNCNCLIFSIKFKLLIMILIFNLLLEFITVIIITEKIFLQISINELYEIICWQEH